MNNSIKQTETEIKLRKEIIEIRKEKEELLKDYYAFILQTDKRLRGMELIINKLLEFSRTLYNHVDAQGLKVHEQLQVEKSKN